MRIMRPMLAFIFVAVLSTVPCYAGVVAADEMMEARRWVAAKFEGIQEAPSLETGLIVRANNDPVQKNRRANRPLKIVDVEYTSGSVLPCGE